MKKEFLQAETMAERRQIAILAANREWAKKNPGLPTKEFYAEFLEPFIQYEDRKFRLEELHLISQTISRTRERELTEAVRFWEIKCVERLSETV